MFKVLVEQIELTDALKKIKNTVGKGKDINNVADKCVYMETYMDGIKKAPMLKIITTNNTEISEVLVEVVNADIGVAPLIEYSKLSGMIDTIDDSVEVQIESVDGSNKLDISYAGRRQPIVLNAMTNTNFPFTESPQTTSKITVPYGVFKEGLDAAASIINDDDRYPMFNCVHVTVAGGQATFQAIDSQYKRMLLFIKPMQHRGEGTFFIECSKVRKMISGFDITKAVDILLSNNNVIFEQNCLKITTRLLNGTFPEIQKFMPNQYAVEAVFDKNEMLVSLTRAKLMLDGMIGCKSCVFNIDQGFLNINLNSTIGALYEMVICTLSGEPIQMAFMVDSMIQALSAFTDTSIKMCFYNKSSCVLMPENPKGYSYKVLLPTVRQLA